MSYTEKELFEFMESGRTVRVTDDEGTEHVGQCWAYRTVTSEENYGIAEPTLEVGCSVVLGLSEIQKIDFAD
jgi:hypothetical protein